MVSTRSSMPKPRRSVDSSTGGNTTTAAPKAMKVPKAERKKPTIPTAVAVVPVLLALFIYVWYYTGVFSDADRIACDAQKQARYDYIQKDAH